MEIGVCFWIIVALSSIGWLYSVIEKKISGITSTTANLTLLYWIYSTQDILYFKILFGLCMFYIILDIVLDNEQYIKKFVFVALLIGMYLGI